MEFATTTMTEYSRNPLRRRILLVEDDISLEHIWRFVVSHLKHECDMEWVTSEAAAERAIWKRKAEGGLYDVIICDIFLSGSKTGIDLWKVCRDEPTEFVFSSGVSPQKFEKLLSAEDREHRFISKPLDPMSCIDTLNMILSHEERNGEGGSVI